MKRYLILIPMILATSAALADAQSQAAALLSGARSTNRDNSVCTVVDSRDARVATDAHAQAAALLSGSRLSAPQAKLTYSGVRTIGAAR
jgi:hypothetical protein